MGFWSGCGMVAVGAATGVGCVAALPVFGPIGVVTALGFAVGGGVGAAGGAAAAVMSGSSGRKSETEAESTPENTAEEIAKAEHSRKRAEIVKTHLAEAQSRDRFLIALYAVSICAAACDGTVSENAKRDIREAVQGLGAKMSSEAVMTAIETLFATPPSVTSAVAWTVEFRDAWEEFDDAVEAGLATKPPTTKALAAFRTAWGQAAAEVGLPSRFAWALLAVHSVVAG